MVTETYRDVVITLLEEENKWRFTANGRERSAPTLPKAREFIDNALEAVNKKRERPWEPIKAYQTNRYGNEQFKNVEITSVADPDKWSGQQVWIKDADGKRSKVALKELYAHSDTNAAIVARILQLDAESERIDKAIAAEREKLQPVVLAEKED